jgi:hypothetical protein
MGKRPIEVHGGHKQSKADSCRVEGQVESLSLSLWSV